MPSNPQERLGISTLRRAPTALKKYVLLVKDAKKNKYIKAKIAEANSFKIKAKEPEKEDAKKLKDISILLEKQNFNKSLFK